MGKHFLWDPVEDNIVKEIDDGGTTIADYTTEPYLYGDLISQHRNGQSSFYHYDGQGSTTSLTGSAANVTDTYAYSAFGDVTTHAGSTENPFQFSGMNGSYLCSTIGEHFLRFRIYSQQIGRWLSLDRIEHFTDSQYCYAKNSPMAFLDPTGLTACDMRKSCTTGPITIDKDKGAFFKEDYLDGFVGREFRVRVEFSDSCECCEYRQFYRGMGNRIRYTPGGEWLYEFSGWTPKVPKDQDSWKEDCAGVIWVETATTFPVPVLDCYGRRESYNRDGDMYSNPPDRDTGCLYESRDAPGLKGINTLRKSNPRHSFEFEMSLSFRLAIYDFCTLDKDGNGTKLKEETFAFVAKMKFPPLKK